MTNLSQQKREKMLEYLHKLKELNTTDDESLSIIGEIETALNEKRYGLVWEEHSEHVDEMLVDNIPVFVDVPEKTIVADEGEKYNFLLEGDNLHSLKLLQKTHAGKVDVIYIDPPYNTGNKDFIYDDSYVDAVDSYSHSKWLSFMDKRLRIADQLLDKNGFIFISIDDNELYQLKLLCDSIFGEDNFIVCLPRQTKKSGKTTDSFSKNHDYVLVYCKGSLTNFKMKEHVDPGYKFQDEHVNERGLYKLNQTLDYDSLSYSKSLDYPLEVEGEVYYPGGSYEQWKERQEGKHNRADWAWRWNKNLFDFAYKNDFVVIKKKKDGSARIYTKTYLNATIEKNNGDYEIVYRNKTKATSSIEFTDNKYSNDNAKKDFNGIGLEKTFDYSKPVSLIKELVSFHKNSDAVILDFFAGSGTTGHAVQELNKEDGGNRTYILCTNNENNICEEVTYQRLSKIQEDLPHNLRYFRTDFVSKQREGRSITRQTLQYVRELIELEHQVRIDGLNNALILNSDSLQEQLLNVYVGANLYVSSWVFFDEPDLELAAEKELNVIYVPDYYFESELIEVGEL